MATGGQHRILQPAEADRALVVLLHHGLKAQRFLYFASFLLRRRVALLAAAFVSRCRAVHHRR